MAITTTEQPGEAAPSRVVVRAVRRRRLRATAMFACGAVALGLVGYGSLETGNGSSTSRSWDASALRLQGQAEAYFAQQQHVARGRAADTARLQAAADAFAQQQHARGTAGDSATELGSG